MLDLVDKGRARRRWPRNADHPKLVQSVAGLTFTSLYRMNEASGSLVDPLTGNNLAAVGTPTYQATIGDRIGVNYDAAGDGHAADVNALALASGLYLACFIPPAAAATFDGIVGRLAASAVLGVYSYCHNAGNYPVAVFADGTSTGVITFTADVRTIQVPILVGIQVDRAASTGRARIARRGVLLEASTVSITGYGTFTGGTGQVFYLGKAPAFSIGGGAKVSWAAAAHGTQCEGADLLANIFRRLRFE